MGQGYATGTCYPGGTAIVEGNERPQRALATPQLVPRCAPPPIVFCISISSRRRHGDHGYKRWPPSVINRAHRSMLGI